MSRFHATSHGMLAVLLALLSMLGPFSIDTIFPGFPDIAREFGAGKVEMQQTLSVYLVAYAAMGLFHGPLSDAYGRRPVIVVGLGVYALSAAAAALTTSMTALLVCRALQGMSAGAGQIVGRAIVRDRYHGAEAQRLMAQVTLIFGIAPAIAPVVGAALLGIAGWRGIFWAMAAFALALGAACALSLPETHAREARQPFAPAPLLATCRHILGDRQFWPLAISSTVNFSALFVYIVSAPAFVLDLLHLSRAGFPWLFVPAIGGMMAGAWLSGRLAGKVSVAATVGAGYAIMLAASAANVALHAWLPQPMLPWSVIPIGVHAIGITLSFPTLVLLLLDRFPAHRGAASSMQTFVALIFNAVLAGAISPLLSDSAPKLALGAALLTAVGFASWRWYRAMCKREAAQAAPAPAA